MQDDGDAGRAISIILAISESDAPSSAFSRISVTVESTFPDTKPTLILQRVAKRHNYRTFIDGSATSGRAKSYPSPRARRRPNRHYPSRLSCSTSTSAAGAVTFGLWLASRSKFRQPGLPLVAVSNWAKGFLSAKRVQWM